MSETTSNFFNSVRMLCLQRNIKYDELNDEVERKLGRRMIAWSGRGSFSIHHVHMLMQFFEVPLEMLVSDGEEPRRSSLLECFISTCQDMQSATSYEDYLQKTEDLKQDGE